jgi:predicted permease
LTPERYPSRAGQDAFFASLEERLRTLPGVRHVALASTLPLGGSNNYTILDPREIRPDDPEQMLLVGTVAVGDDYPAALGLSLLAGRGFTAEDRDGSPRVTIVSLTLARRLWGEVSPLGKPIPLGEENGVPVSATVVGVAADQRYGHLDDDPEPAMYLPRPQVRNARPESWILIRVAGETRETSARVREAVRSLDAGQPIGELVSMSEVVSRSTAARRFNLLLVAAFAALALALAVLGIAGVTAYSLSQRARELGIRVALGAEPKDLLSLGLGEIGRVVAISAAVGLIAALGAARALRAMLFGVGPSDPLTYVGATLLLAAAAFLASYLPIRRAADADPMVTLRTD